MPLLGVRTSALIIPLFLLGMSACDTQEQTPSAEDTGNPGDTDPMDSEGDDTASFFTEEERSTILAWLGPLPDEVPADPSNAFADDDAAAALGQALFFEDAYSENGDISCSTCHDPAAAFDESRDSNTSEGVSFTERSSMSVLNGAFAEASEQASPWQFWDGRADSQWAQALEPPESDVEMGSTRVRVALVVYDHYRADYEAIFGPFPTLHDGNGNPLAPDDAKPGTEAWDALSSDVQDAFTEVYVNYGKAIAAYERRLVSRNSRFDIFWEELAAGAEDSATLTDVEKEGLRVFIGKGRCLGCHSGPNFTDGQFHNTAVPQIGEHIVPMDDGRALGLEQARDSPFNCMGPWSDHPNKGACAINQIGNAQGEQGAFKTSSLRDIANRAPFMHTGSMATIEQAIQHYDIGGAPPGLFAGQRDELMRPIGLANPERIALAAFLRALNGEPLPAALLEDPR